MENGFVKEPEKENVKKNEKYEKNKAAEPQKKQRTLPDDREGPVQEPAVRQTQRMFFREASMRMSAASGATVSIPGCTSYPPRSKHSRMGT